MPCCHLVARWPRQAATAAEPTRIVVHADQPGTPISRYLTGACIEDVNHEIYGGLYSQMLFGESFQEPATTPPPPGFQAFGGQWAVRDGVLTAVGPDGPKLVAILPAGRVNRAWRWRSFCRTPAAETPA